MSTPRAFKPVFGPSYRLLLDQLVPQSTGRSRMPGKLVSSRLSNLVCPSCHRHGSVLNLNPQLRFSSSSSSTPPKPPSSDDDGTKNAVSTQDPSAPSPSTPLSSSGEPEPGPGPESKQNNPDLPSAQNSRRSSLNRSLSAFMDRAQTTLFAASQRINDLTGYSGIETLKTQIGAVEASLAAAQSALHSARSSYKTSVSSRSGTQREITTLLARQKTWTPADFERFTALYRQDYELEAQVAARAAELEDAERDAERLARELGSGILARYHEEQIWSDKIRRMSTWGTWGLMGVNVLLFLVFQFGAEPWRRRRLVRGFEEKVREALEEERRLREAAEKERDTKKREEDERVAAGIAVPPASAAAAAAEIPATVEVVGEEQEQGSPAAQPEEAVNAAVVDEPSKRSWQEVLSDPDWWRATLNDLSSERKVAVRMRDVSMIALEAAAAGAALAGTIAIFFIRRT
ncbi:Mdm33 family-domain-containing protein [Hypoxylon sp. NC1633]|nr:Mdm33 family-domain-containing protein [Hypoxylon sp. NC1633]